MRRLRPLLIPLAILFSGTSAARLDRFVASGDYARARLLVADCRRVFIPASLQSDLHPKRTGLAGLVSFEAVGSDLAYMYRPADLGTGVLTEGANAGYPWLYTGADSAPTRLDVLNNGALGTSVASTTSMEGCGRISISAAPRVLQVGIPGGGEGGTSSAGNEVITLAKFSELAYGRNDPKADRYYQARRDANTIRPINPDTITGEMTLRTYLNGQPAGGQAVELWADPRGVPDPGHTYPHAHIARGDPDLMPSIVIVGTGITRANADQHTRVQTDPTGVVTFKIHPGFRGGPEAIIASTQFAGLSRPTLDARAVIVQHRGGLVAWSVATDNAQGLHEPSPSPNFPFEMTGWTARHPNNHFVRGDIARTMAQMFKEIWARDPGRSHSATPRYMQLNDMSLEYGGLLKISEGSRCMTSEGSHKTHLGGIDFDISPCFTEGKTGRDRVGAKDCELDQYGKQHLKIDEGLLSAIVIGNYGGAIYEHHKFIEYPGTHVDGAPYHYHIRFPDHPVRGNGNS